MPWWYLTALLQFNLTTVTLLHGTSVKNLNKMQVAQNELARAVCHAARSASANELRRQLHWLPVRQRINYKLALLTYKTRSTGTPAYLASLLQSYRSARTLWSSNNNLLTVPQLSLALSAEAFCVSGPTVWKSLPNSCKQAELVSTFKCTLTSDWFYLAYGEQPTVLLSSHLHKAPLSHFRRMALYKFVTDRLIVHFPKKLLYNHAMTRQPTHKFKLVIKQQT